MGTKILEDKPVLSRNVKYDNPDERWKATLRVSQGHRNDNDVMPSPGREAQVSMAEHARFHSPPRVRIQAAPTLDTKHDQRFRVAEAEMVAEEVFKPNVPAGQGRVKSAAEKIKARQAAAAKAAAEKELSEYNKTSDMGDRAVDFDGDGRVDFAEWQRANKSGLHAKSGNRADLPPEVQHILKRMRDNGFADCYFFRMIDKDGNGQVTKGEFEQGLQLLKIDLLCNDFNALYKHFDKNESGRIDYLELQKALQTEDGTASTRPRWGTAQPSRPIAGPDQFSKPGNAYPLL